MNKFIFLLTLIFLPQVAFSSLCGRQTGANHKNPDGSVGGFVSDTATVASTVYVDSSSSVCDKARVQGLSRMSSGTRIFGNASIEGSVHIKASKVGGFAKIHGKAVVTNSFICQMSNINFNVTNSTYYCELEGDEEPNDPGEIGKKTVLGIDSDVDGVRDDVEIWINNQTTNTPDNDMYNTRMALKQIAKSVQLAFKNKDNKELAKKYMLEYLSGWDCLTSVSKLKSEEIQEMLDFLRIEILNTEERFYAWARTNGSLNGSSLEREEKNFCFFKKK